jgi:hypothetical protein
MGRNWERLTWIYPLRNSHFCFATMCTNEYTTGVSSPPTFVLGTMQAPESCLVGPVVQICIAPPRELLQANEQDGWRGVCGIRVVTGLRERLRDISVVSNLNSSRHNLLYRVHSESIQPPWLFPHFVTLQPYSKIDLKRKFYSSIYTQYLIKTKQKLIFLKY